MGSPTRASPCAIPSLPDRFTRRRLPAGLATMNKKRWMPGVDLGRLEAMRMPMKLAQIETEALKLGVRSRARLARKLLESLETDHERAWYDEAERRERELDEGKTDTIPAREVLRRLRSEIGKKRRTS